MDLQCNLLRSLQHFGFDIYENTSSDSQFAESPLETLPTVPTKTVFSSSLPSSSILLDISLLVVLACLALHYFIYTKHIAQWKKSNIPFLQPLFLVGHKYFLKINKTSYLGILNRIYGENPDKDVVGFFLGKTPTVLIRNPQLIQQIMVKNFDKAYKSGWGLVGEDCPGRTRQYMEDYLSNKDSWKSSRTTLAPAFSTSRVSAVNFDTVRGQLDTLWERLHEAQVSGKPVRANEIALNFAVDVGSLWLYGQESNSYQQQTALHRMIKDVRKPSLPKFLSVFAGTSRSSGLPWISNLYKYDAPEGIDEVHNHLHRQFQSQNIAKNKDSDMDQLVGLSHAITTLGLGSENLLNVAILHLLSLRPEHQNRIRAEIQETMKKHKTSVLTSDVVQDLRFTQQCIYESARLLPSNLEFIRYCDEDFRVPGFKYTFRKGDQLIVCLYPVHRDPKYFKNPDTFDPDRFSPENKGSIAPETFLGFGFGPRKCLGYKMGIMMSATLIASLLLKYNIKPRSHFKQMDVTDFYPEGFHNSRRAEVLIDLEPVENVPQ